MDNICYISMCDKRCLIMKKNDAFLRWLPAAVLDLIIMTCSFYFSVEAVICFNHEKLETKLLKRTNKKNTPHNFESSKGRPATILNLISKVKFDRRNEIRRQNTIGNHVLHYFVR